VLPQNSGTDYRLDDETTIADKWCLSQFLFFTPCVITRAVESESKQFWMTGVITKKFQMVELDPEIWVPIQQTVCCASELYK